MNHTFRLINAVLLFTVVSASSQTNAKGIDAVTITDKGTHYEVLMDYTQAESNFEMGEQLYKQIITAVPDYENIVDSYLAELFPATEIYHLILSRVNDIKPGIPAQYKDEIEGMGSKVSGTDNVLGDGKVSVDELYMMQLLPDVAREAECSGISVFGSRSACGSPMTARILDWYGGAKDQLPKIQAVTTIRNNKNTICMIGYLGLAGVLTAFNNDGVFAGILDSPSNQLYSSLNKRSYILDIRLALEKYSNITDVASFLSDTSRKYTFNHLVLLSDKNSAGVLENNFSGQGSNVRRALRTDTSSLNPGITWGFSNAVATVNSFLLSGNLDNHTTVGNNTGRWDTFKKELQRCGNDVTMDELKQIVSVGNVNPQKQSDSSLYSLSTQQIVLFRPSDFHFEVSFRPKQNSLPDAPFFETIPVNSTGAIIQKSRSIQSQGILKNGNFPVPADGSNTVVFNVSHTSDVTILLYDALGREVRSDFLGCLSAGIHKQQYSSKELKSGLYFYCIKNHIAY
jgi:hypothetical protein